MNLLTSLGRICAGILAPQSCVLCEACVEFGQLQPLCSRCLGGLPFLTEPLCRRCGLPISFPPAVSSEVCGECRGDPPPFDSARSFGPYSGSLRQLIHSYKFEGYKRLSAPMAGLLEECLHRVSPIRRPRWIVPIPLHRKRLRARGFDQTQRLGRELSRLTAIPLRTALRRARATTPQVGLSHAQRTANLKSAFELKAGSGLEGARVLLLDDVLTTGATASEAARVVREEGGADEVHVLTLARALRHEARAVLGLSGAASSEVTRCST